jgi:hypothetical protein
LQRQFNICPTSVFSREKEIALHEQLPDKFGTYLDMAAYLYVGLDSFFETREKDGEDK